MCMYMCSFQGCPLSIAAFLKVSCFLPSNGSACFHGLSGQDVYIYDEIEKCAAGVLVHCTLVIQH